MKNILSFLCVAIFLVQFLACSKESTTSHTSSHQSTLPVDTSQTSTPIGLHADGFGPSNKPLTGIPFRFPAGVTINGSIMTNMNNWTNMAFYECATDGDLPYYMSLQNGNAIATMVIFPAGIVIPSPDSLTQGGVIVQPDTVIIAPASTLCVNLNAFCINRHRGFYQNMTCGNMLITDNDNLTPLITILSQKKTVSYDNHSYIQTAVWDVADSGKLSPTDIAAMNVFP